MPYYKRNARNNPRITRGLAARPSHRDRYYTAQASIQVSPGVKAGLAAIAEGEGRTLSWVVNEVFRDYFKLRDDTPRYERRRRAE